MDSFHVVKLTIRHEVSGTRESCCESLGWLCVVASHDVRYGENSRGAFFVLDSSM